LYTIYYFQNLFQGTFAPIKDVYSPDFRSLVSQTLIKKPIIIFMNPIIYFCQPKISQFCKHFN